MFNIHPTHALDFHHQKQRDYLAAATSYRLIRDATPVRRPGKTRTFRSFSP